MNTEEQVDQSHFRTQREVSSYSDTVLWSSVVFFIVATLVLLVAYRQSKKRQRQEYISSIKNSYHSLNSNDDVFEVR